MLMQGVNVKVAQEHLAHKDISTTIVISRKYPKTIKMLFCCNRINPTENTKIARVHLAMGADLIFKGFIIIISAGGGTVKEMEIIQHRQIDGLTMFINTVEYRATHVHSEWELIWILDQPLSITCASEVFRAEPGQMVLFSPNEPHEFRKVISDCTFLCLQISEKILPPMSKMVVSEHLPHAWLEAEAYTRLQQTLIQVMQCYLRRKENYSLYCVGQSCLVLHLLLSKMPVKELSAEEQISIDKRNARLKRLLGFVDENYMHKIRLTDFARQEGCSLSYLSRFIKEVLNQSFQEYVTSVRFNCACKLIASGQKRMLDVCMESGFSDYRYFSREFQRQYGMTPEQYRNLSQKEQLSAPAIRHSLHSVERFYTEEESLEIMQRLVG